MKVLDLTGLSPVCDFFVLATATSGRQMGSVARETEELAGDYDLRALHSVRRAEPNDRWVGHRPGGRDRSRLRGRGAAVLRPGQPVGRRPRKALGDCERRPTNWRNRNAAAAGRPMSGAEIADSCPHALVLRRRSLPPAPPRPRGRRRGMDLPFPTLDAALAKVKDWVEADEIDDDEDAPMFSRYTVSTRAAKARPAGGRAAGAVATGAGLGVGYKRLRTGGAFRAATGSCDSTSRSPARGASKPNCDSLSRSYPLHRKGVSRGGTPPGSTVSRLLGGRPHRGAGPPTR